MLKNNIYNIDKEFDYPTIKDIVIQSLEKILKEEALKNMPRNIIFDSKATNVKLLTPPTPPSLKLRIRNTTKYLNWRLSILKRDNFTCK